MTSVSFFQVFYESGNISTSMYVLAFTTWELNSSRCLSTFEHVDQYPFLSYCVNQVLKTLQKMFKTFEKPFIEHWKSFNNNFLTFFFLYVIIHENAETYICWVTYVHIMHSSKAFPLKSGELKFILTCLQSIEEQMFSEARIFYSEFVSLSSRP